MRLQAGLTTLNSLSGTLAQETLDAQKILDDTSEQVQLQGWYFNKETDYSLTADLTGKIALPSTVLNVDVTSPTNKELIQIGSYLYDKTNKTYTITDTVKADIIFKRSFTDLPYAVANYIAARAATRFVAQQLGDRDATADAASEEAKAWALLKQSEGFIQDPNMLDYLDFHAQRSI